MPEEFFFLVLELVAGVAGGLTPASLNRLILQYSVDNKFGHTQVEWYLYIIQGAGVTNGK